MNRWTLAAAVLFIVVLAGSYIVFKGQGSTAANDDTSAEAELNVEDFDIEGGGEIDPAAQQGEADQSGFEADAQDGATSKAGPRRESGEPTPVETIEDDEELGETFDGGTTSTESERGATTGPSGNKGN